MIRKNVGTKTQFEKTTSYQDFLYVRQFPIALALPAFMAASSAKKSLPYTSVIRDTT